MLTSVASLDKHTPRCVVVLVRQFCSIGKTGIVFVRYDYRDETEKGFACKRSFTVFPLLMSLRYGAVRPMRVFVIKDGNKRTASRGFNTHDLLTVWKAPELDPAPANRVFALRKHMSCVSSVHARRSIFSGATITPEAV